MNVNDFKDFLDKLYENLNFSYDIEYEYEDNICNGYFLDNEIMFQIENIGSNCWFYKFFRLDKSSNTYVSHMNINDNLFPYGKKTNILGTIKKSLFDFIEKEKPNLLSFSSDDIKSRKSLYELFCSELIKVYPNYTYAVFNGKDRSLFVIYTDTKYLDVIKKYFENKF